MAKHTTRKAEDFMKANGKDEFDNLPKQTKSLELVGWFSPSEDRELPQVLKGYVLDIVARKAPKKNQSETFMVFKLAAPIIGLRFVDGEKGEEDTLEPQEVIGIDMRQGLQVLHEHRGAAKIVFVEKQEIDDRQWWKIDVFFQPSAAPKPVPLPVNEQTDDIPF